MSTVANLPENEWVTKQEASHFLQVAERTIDRLAARGALQKRTQRRPGQQTIAVYHTPDLARYAAARAERYAAAAASAAAYVMPAKGLAVPGGPVTAGPTADALTRLADLLAGRINPRASLYISVDEAAIRPGLNERYVRQCVRSGKLRAVRLMVDGRRVTRVRAADLDTV